MSIASYLKKNDIYRVAIYGMNQLGYTLTDELVQDGITVVYGIDKVVAGKAEGISVKGLDESWERVDAIIVSAFQYYEDIYPLVQEKVPDITIIPLDVMMRRVLRQVEY